MRTKEEQAAALQAQLLGLEATRNALAEELVAAAQAAEAGQAAQRELARLRAEHQQALDRLRGAAELLGEREERVAELEADVADMKAMYQEQARTTLPIPYNPAHAPGLPLHAGPAHAQRTSPACWHALHGYQLALQSI